MTNYKMGIAQKSIEKWAIFEITWRPPKIQLCLMFCVSTINTTEQRCKGRYDSMLDEKKLRFGYNFKRICKENDVHISDVAESTGIPSRTLYNIANRNTKKPRGDVMEKIVKDLQKRLPELNLKWSDFLPSYDPEEDAYSVEQLNAEAFVPVDFEIVTEDQELLVYLTTMSHILQRLTLDGKIEAVSRVEKLLKDPRYSRV